MNWHRYGGNYCTVGLLLSTWTLLRSPRLLLALASVALLWLYLFRVRKQGREVPNLGLRGGVGEGLGGSGGGARQWGLLAVAILVIYLCGLVLSMALVALWAAIMIGAHACLRTSKGPTRDVRHPSTTQAAGFRGGGRGGESGAESDGGGGAMYGGGWQPMGPGGSADGGLRARSLQQQQQQQQQYHQQHQQQQQQQQQQHYPHQPQQQTAAAFSHHAQQQMAFQQAQAQTAYQHQQLSGSLPSQHLPRPKGH